MLVLLLLLEMCIIEFLLDGFEFTIGCIEEFLGRLLLSTKILNRSVDFANCLRGAGNALLNLDHPCLGLLDSVTDISFGGISNLGLSFCLILVHSVELGLVVTKLSSLLFNGLLETIQNLSGLIGFHPVSVELFGLCCSLERLSLFLHLVECHLVGVVFDHKCCHGFSLLIGDGTFIILLRQNIIVSLALDVLFVEGIIFLLLFSLLLSSSLLSSAGKECLCFVLLVLLSSVFGGKISSDSGNSLKVVGMGQQFVFGSIV